MAGQESAPQPDDSEQHRLTHDEAANADPETFDINAAWPADTQHGRTVEGDQTPPRPGRGEPSS